MLSPHEAITSVALLKGLHPVCCMCFKLCKEKYAYWGGQMPPEVFCYYFTENPKVMELLCAEDGTITDTEAA